MNIQTTLEQYIRLVSGQYQNISININILTREVMAQPIHRNADDKHC